MPALASLLGLPPAPVISPMLLSTRLSKHEQRLATAAYHRARGYQDTLDFARFRDSILHEAFLAMPALIMQRIFFVWSYVDKSDGDVVGMTLKEFLVGVMIVAKSTREEQLRFVFQLMDTSGSQELSKKDTLAFLAAVAKQDKVVAVEKVNNDSAVPWTVNALADLLHPTEAELLTPTKFVKVLSSKQFHVLYLLDWIPVFAAQFQLASAPPGGALGSASPCVSPTAGVLKPQEHQEISSSSSLSVERGFVNGAKQTHARGKRSSLESPIELTATTLDSIRREFHGILDYLVNTGEPFAIETFLQRFSGIVCDTVLRAVREVEKMYPVRTAADDRSLQGRKSFKHFMAILLSAYTTDADGMLRLLFAMLDEGSRGRIDALQFAVYLRFSSFMTQTESERSAFSMIERLHNSSSPPASPTRPCDSAQRTIDAPSLSMKRFVELAHRSSCSEVDLSSSDLEIVHLLFHLHYSTLVHGANGANPLIGMHSIKQHTKQLRLAKQMHSEADAEEGFCLVERLKWNHFIDITCDDDDEEDADDTHDALANDVGVPFAEQQSADVESSHTGISKDELVLVPLSLWIVLSFWQNQRRNRRIHAAQLDDWREWTTDVKFQPDSKIFDDAGYHHTFRGFCVAVSLKFAALDGMERQCAISHAIVSDHCSIQDLVDAVRLHKQWRSAAPETREDPVSSAEWGVKTFSECQLLTCADNSSGATQALNIPEDLLGLPLKDLLSTILPQDSHPASMRHFELQTSIVETMEPNGSTGHPCSALPKQRVPSPTTSSQLRRSSRLNAATGLSNIHGLANLGNTCFMNSALQCLVATPLLREYFLHQEYLFDLATHYTGDEFNAQGVGSSGSPKGGKTTESLPNSYFLPLAFGQLVAEMNAFSSTGAISGVCDVISPEKMQQAIAILFPHLSDGSQQDAQEFLSSLLSSLGEELKREPVQVDRVSEDSILSPQSRAFLSRLPSFSRNRENTEDTRKNDAESDPRKLRFQVSDSNGRPDAEVATEWWISHLIREPSIFSALFCGQFKSVLTCEICGAKSARFEPFSSLQLPIVDENGSRRMSKQTLDIVVILHFAQPSHSPSALRLAVQAGHDWTLEQLFIKLQQDHASFSQGSRRQYVAVVIDGCCIQDYIDRDTLLMTIPSTIDVFELENVSDETDTEEHSVDRLDRALHVGDELLVWTAEDRFVKGVVTLTRNAAPKSAPASYDVILNEGLSCGRSMRAVSRVRPVCARNNRAIFFRFVHRRQVLVPFYCTSPYRLALCGFPTIHKAHSSSISGKFLYRVAQQRFLPAFSNRKFKSDVAASHITNTFVLRRVRADGKCCNRCHWTEKCVGCLVPRSNDALEDLEMDETIAIDWTLDPGGERDAESQHYIEKDQVERLLAQGMMPVTDDESYLLYRQTSSHSLERSLEMLCSTENLEARCSECQNRRQNLVESGANDGHSSKMAPGCIMSPHTKALSLWSAPPILIIQLKRFELGSGYSWEKLNHCVDFPIEGLDLAPFIGHEEGDDRADASSEKSGRSGDECNENVKRAAAFLHEQLAFPLDTASRECSSYSLYGIVNHMGEIGSGHYTAHIKHPESGEWWLVDDAVGIPANIQNVTPSSAAYLLFYVRHDIIPLSPPPAAAAAANNEASMRGMATTIHKRKRLSSFYPRQPNATRLSETTIQAAWQNETWLRATRSRTHSPSSPFSKEKSDKADGNCNLM